MESSRPILGIQKLNKHAKTPFYGTAASAGADLASTEDVELKPGERALVGTGLKILLPENSYGRIAPRSGLAVRHGIHVLGGVIDADYRGEVKVILINLGQEAVKLKAGSRIAQLIVQPCLSCEVCAFVETDETDRGAGGFGSTGV